MLGWCWPSVYDAGRASVQHWANTSCLLGLSPPDKHLPLSATFSWTKPCYWIRARSPALCLRGENTQVYFWHPSCRMPLGISTLWSQYPTYFIRFLLWIAYLINVLKYRFILKRCNSNCDAIVNTIIRYAAKKYFQIYFFYLAIHKTNVHHWA